MTSTHCPTLPPLPQPLEASKIHPSSYRWVICASLAYLIAYALNLSPSLAPMAAIPTPLAAPSR